MAALINDNTKNVSKMKKKPIKMEFARFVWAGDKKRQKRNEYENTMKKG